MLFNTSVSVVSESYSLITIPKNYLILLRKSLWNLDFSLIRNRSLTNIDF